MVVVVISFVRTGRIREVSLLLEAQLRASASTEATARFTPFLKGVAWSSSHIFLPLLKFTKEAGSRLGAQEGGQRC